jgi:hypothetical protein
MTAAEVKRAPASALGVLAACERAFGLRGTWAALAERLTACSSP